MTNLSLFFCHLILNISCSIVPNNFEEYPCCDVILKQGWFYLSVFNNFLFWS